MKNAMNRANLSDFSREIDELSIILSTNIPKTRTIL